MLYTLGRWCFDMRRRVIAGWLAVLVLLGGVGALTYTGFNDEFEIPGTPAQVALDELYMTFPEVAGTRASMIVVAPPGQKVDDPGFRQRLESQFDELDKLDMVDMVASPYDDMVKGLINDDHTAALVNITLDVDPIATGKEELQPLLDTADHIESMLPEGSRVAMGGDAFAVQVPGMSIVEVIGVIVALVVLIITLGSVLAAGMPLVTAILGVAVTMLLMLGATGVMSISSTAPMLAVMLGLAVGIDYALLILTRYRELAGTGLDMRDAAARAMATAGSAVVFAGVTCVIALVGLSVAGIPFLTVMGVFAAIGVTVAVALALTMLPAFMGLAGERLRPKERRTRRPRTPETQTPKKGFFARWVQIVTRWPWVTVAVVVLVFGALSLPAKDLHLALPNAGQNAAGSPERVTYDLIDSEFGPGFNGPLIVTAEIIQSTDPLGLMDDLKGEVEQVPGVKLVALATPNPNADTGFIQVVPDTAPDDPATTDLVNALREKQDDWEERLGVQTAVTGMTAVQIDISERLGGAMLPFGIFVVGLSLILLTMVFRSIWVPIKTALGYLLSVGTAFGATVLVFNEGIGRAIVNLEQPQAVISFFPIILMGILFGLAMDYEVFLVARMREEYSHGASAHDAIHRGFVGSGKVVVATASIMVAVFAFFVPEGEGAIKAIAFGLAVGVAVDAFIVRMTLVPAVMTLLGDHAWWIPRWLDKRLPTFDVEGESMARLVELEDWGATDAIRTKDFAVWSPGQGRIHAQVALAVPRGDVLVVEAERPRRVPLLYALAGRVRGTEGTAKILGRLLPDQGAEVRREVEIVDGTSSVDLRAQIARSLARKRCAMLVIEGADALPTHDARDALTDLLAGVGQQHHLTIVLGVADVAVVEPLIHTRYHCIELLPDADDPEPDTAPDADRELVSAGGH